MFAEDTIFDVVGCLEFDPGLPTPKRHRQYLRSIAQFHQVCRHQLNFFLFPFCKENYWFARGANSMTPLRGNTFLLCFSQQRPRLCLGPMKAFFELTWCSASRALALCVALGAEVPGHSQKQLTQTLIDWKRTFLHQSSLVKSQQNRIELSTQTWVLLPGPPHWQPRADVQDPPDLPGPVHPGRGPTHPLGVWGEYALHTLLVHLLQQSRHRLTNSGGRKVPRWTIHSGTPRFHPWFAQPLGKWLKFFGGSQSIWR